MRLIETLWSLFDPRSPREIVGVLLAGSIPVFGVGAVLVLRLLWWW